MEKNNFRKIATITLFESAVQWYCFLLYGTAAGTVFNKVFFSQTGNGTTALILSYMSFAIGYIAGPFGAIFFGHIGDRKGRKVTMYASLLMMGISTSIIGILPPAASAGVGVVIVLQLMRLAQCFGRGGTWGWRIPFLAAIILTLIVIRQKGEMMETEDYKKAQAKLEAEEAEGKKHKVGFIPMVKGYWKTLLLGCGTRWVDGTFYNIFIVWILSYCINWLGMPLIQTYIITIIACIFKIPFTLFGGWCAQKLGNTRTFVIGALASAVLSIPTLKVIELSKGNLAITIIGIVLGWSIAYNLIWAVISSLWSSYFETEVRYSGISFVYHVPSFLVAGMVPTICTLLINYGKGDTIYVGIYSTVVALISAACALALKARHDRGEK
ncbi:MHS family MFS transporter [Anaerostipes hadrus]|uniref:MFS transporter n=1 Tax=Anaerostipes hadrus TaxID=649756 RepID=UPI00156EDA35|nr:MFS transporter [Anaerostipes hadrus]NSH28468.1 MHS family MFS transporter [Anaerostipes hadrus]NSH43035.1 MHS family MFS transporter [Anaerostipes hadrus]